MKVIIMRGIPGSGKSTYVAKYHPHAVVCSADAFFTHGEDYDFIPAQLGGARASCLRKFVALLQQSRQLIVVDNTNISVADVAPYVALAEAHGYSHEIITLGLKDVMTAARNVHGVRYATCKHMHDALNAEEARFPQRWKYSFVAVES